MGCQASRVIGASTESRKKRRFEGAGCVVSSENEWEDLEFDKMSFDSLLTDYKDILPGRSLPPGIDDHILNKQRLDAFLWGIQLKPQKFEKMVAYRRQLLLVTKRNHLGAKLPTKVHALQLW